tara:strand:- start:1368 stop:1916 length:549 start_codon:yes stop_codon:yes gene_type:complete
MAKKTLNEAVVRRFQKLANLAPINEMYSMRDEEEEKMEETIEETYMEAEEEPAAEMDAPELPEEEPEMDVEDGDLELSDEEALAIIELGKKLEAAMGDEEEVELDMDDAPEMDEEEPAPMMETEEINEEEINEEEELAEALSEVEYVPSQNEIVNEVARRVALRLKQAKLHEAKLKEALGRK